MTGRTLAPNVHRLEVENHTDRKWWNTQAVEVSIPQFPFRNPLIKIHAQGIVYKELTDGPYDAFLRE